MKYQKTSTDTVIRLKDGAFIPADPKNADYAQYLSETGKGEIATPYIAPPPEAEKPPKLTQGQARVRLAGAGFTPAQVDALLAVVAAIEA